MGELTSDDAGVPVPNPTTYPYYTNGQFKFRTQSGQYRYCSGSMIFTNLFLTAAHCIYLHDDGGWITSGEFYLPFVNNPAYNWTANYWIAPCRWILNTSYAYDWAIVNTTRTNAFPGYTGSQWNQSPSFNSIYQHYGYPDANPTMMTENLTFIGYSTKPVDDLDITGSLVAANNTFTPGSSGGPWWRTPWTPTPGPYANGVNSVGYGDDLITSPYFDTVYDEAFAWFRSHGGA